MVKYWQWYVNLHYVIKSENVEDKKKSITNVANDKLNFSGIR
jgi:hypothetical protein